MAADITKITALYDLLADHFKDKLAAKEITGPEVTALVKFLQNSGVTPDPENWPKGQALLDGLPSAEELDKYMGQ